MPIIKPVRGFTPKIGAGTFVAENAVIVGDVTLGTECSVAKIHDYALIGMGAIVMDDAEVGEGALVAAGSVVLSRTKIGAHELWAGAPAKFIKMVEPEKAREMNVKIAKNYLMYSRWYDSPEGEAAMRQDVPEVEEQQGLK